MTETVEPNQYGTPKLDELIAIDFLKPPVKPGSLGLLGPYDVTEVLGRGGFGIVLKAFDPALNRFVAIKVLSSQLAVSAAARSRFAREARAAAAVVHENVVAIHAVDSWNGLPYLVMPCIDGRSLQERVDRDGPMAVKEVLRVGMQAAQGLAAAHDQGLVHRDIKPSNILLENGVERVKLSDFGLARAVDDASLTQSGVLAGTPQYMSPEQARGEVVDHRSDLFSLGGVMYFMCAGHPPFRANSTPAVLRRVCDDPHRPLRDINPDVPDWLAAVIDRLLAKEAGGRFSSATQVAEVLKHHLAELQRTGSSAALPWMTPTTVRKLPKPKIVAGVIVTSIVLLGLALLGTSNRNLTFLSFLGGNASRAENPTGTGNGGAAASQVNVGNPSNPLLIGSGRTATKDMGLADFESLEVTHPFIVDVVRGERFGVTVSADDNVLEHVRALKEGSVLKIALAEGKQYRVKAGSLKATISMPVLAGVRLTHGARLTVQGFKSDRDFKALVSHGSSLEGEIEAGKIALDASHGSTIHLKGKARDARLIAQHGGKLLLADLALGAVEIDAHHGSISRFVARTIERAKIKASHGGIVIGSVDSSEVDLEAEHGAKVFLNGRARHAGLEASHGCLLALAGLELDGVKAELDHSSSATVNAKDLVDYQVGNSSSLKYIGKPRVGQARASRSSTVRSITAVEGEKENPAPPEATSKPALNTQEDILISTAGVGTGVNQIGYQAVGSIIGSGVPASKVWDLADFTAVQIGGTFHSEIKKGDKFKVVTSSDDNVTQHIQVVKKGKTLQIGLERGLNYRLKEPLKAEIVLPALEGLDVGGASKAVVEGFRSEQDFKLRLHGASKIEGSISFGDASIDVSGASHLTLNGSGKAAQISGSGASHLKLGRIPPEKG